MLDADPAPPNGGTDTPNFLPISVDYDATVQAAHNLYCYFVTK